MTTAWVHETCGCHLKPRTRGRWIAQFQVHWNSMYVRSTTQAITHHDLHLCEIQELVNLQYLVQSLTKWFADDQGASLYALLSMAVGIMIRLTHPDFLLWGTATKFPSSDLAVILAPSCVTPSSGIYRHIWAVWWMKQQGHYHPNTNSSAPSPSYRMRNSSLPFQGLRRSLVETLWVLKSIIPYMMKLSTYISHSNANHVILNVTWNIITRMLDSLYHHTFPCQGPWYRPPMAAKNLVAKRSNNRSSFCH